ncbi:MAG: GNAT family N-acetyltransferase [Saprospiraceae bacterium]|nr:GNAT family N-acetyltransferase [Saprospiraceae bacterium]
MIKYTYKAFTPVDLPTENQIQQITDFLNTHLQEYGDDPKDIRSAIDFALDEKEKFGGLVILAFAQKEIAGAVIINKTGMGGYIPENILVYIAVHQKHRGQGLGKKLMQHAIKLCDGAIALHVEPDNPAKFLYEKMGFENKYLEMRYNR